MRALLLLSLLASPVQLDPVELKPFDPVDTSAGKLVRREAPGEDKPLRLFLNSDQQIYARDGSLELSYLIPQATPAGDDAVLVAVGSDVPAEKSCTRFVFITLPKSGKPAATAEFGDCSDQFSIQREGAAITVKFTAHGDAWTYQDGKLTKGAATPKKASGKKKRHAR